MTDEADNVGPDCDDTLLEMEYNPGTSPSTAVIEAIASVEDVDPVGLSTAGGVTLHDYVDPDGLDRLLTNGGGDDLSISLCINEYTMRMDSDRIVVAHTPNARE
jgi:hypothetical protein